MMDIDTLIAEARDESRMGRQWSAKLLDQLADALTDARARLAAAETLARALDEDDGWYPNEMGPDYCRYCHANFRPDWVPLVDHATDCPVTLARALLATEGEGR